MNAFSTVRLIAASLLACLLLAVAATTPTEAQTKKKKPAQTQQQPVRKQQPAAPAQQQTAEEEEEAEEADPPAAVPQTRTPGQPQNFKDLLKQYVGKNTNLGTLRRITNDYVIFEDEFTSTMIRLDVIHSVTVIREEESEPRVEIGVLGKD